MAFVLTCCHSNRTIEVMTTLVLCIDVTCAVRWLPWQPQLAFVASEALFLKKTSFCGDFDT
jgi:hypothetical protein